MGPITDSGNGSHYQTAMADIHRELRRPTTQRKVFSLTQTSPTDLVRSKLSTSEIQSRALSSVPDELLANIPEDSSSYSLFEGFKATQDDHEFRKAHRRRSSKGKKLLKDGEAAGALPSAPTDLKKERDLLSRRLDLMGVRKNMCSSEIHEIDNKIANLHNIRKIVLDRLAGLEMEEAELEHQWKRSMPILHEHFAPGSQIKEMQAHTDMVTAIDFDYPFGTMVSAALDDTVRVWDLNTGRCTGFLEGHNASVRCLQVEDNIVATGSMDASVKLWDLSRARTVTRDNRLNKPSEGEGEDDNASDAFSLFSATTLEDCYVFSLDAHVDEVTALHFRGNTLISGSADKTLRQWDLVKGRCVQTLDVLWAAAQASTLAADTQWRPSGRLPDASADFVGALQCFDAALACGTADGMVRLWDLRSGQVHRSLVGHTGPITCLQFDEVHLVTGSQDRSIRIWDLRMGSIFDAYAYDKPITSMMFDTKRIVAAAGENVVKVYDKADGHHWDCGAGVGADESGPAPATVERVRLKDGYLLEGRKDGTVAAWTC
ncbi:hypothetical protein WD repeat protein [Aspergillus fumigatus]|nr:hypothetical protein WD repeat protein [Aspergillus fumigatus]